ncbi:MAG: Exocyst complex component 5 [Thelocarpon impressellum]|nr:MAG: Exocyst complex component 5 [Thelocarpon impressellum]
MSSASAPPGGLGGIAHSAALAGGAGDGPLHTPSGRSIFPRAPSFSLENFSSKDFIVKDFVESLSDSAVPVNRRSGPSTQAFDPKPFIRTFEHALSRLSTLSEDLESHETELLTGVRRAELQHSQTLDSLGKKLDHTIDSFQSLDTSLNGADRGADGYGEFETGGNAAVRIGERLEELDKQRRRAQDARFLIQCWMEVSERGELTSLEDVRRRDSGEGKVRCAVIARQLTRISQRLDPDSWAQANGGRKSASDVDGSRGRARAFNTRELIEKFSETLEKDLLKQFDHFYRRQNFGGMQECANVLHDFNGGASVVALFVNQHQFFIDRSQLITDEVDGDGETWERLADPDAEPPGVEPSLQSLVDEVKVVVQEESAIIKRAFPYHELVLGKFLQRVFQQSIQQRLEMVLNKADTISSLAFLRSLQAARSYINSLVDDMKAHGLTEHPETTSSQTTLILDQQMDDLFVPYLLGGSYIEREKKSLEELYSSLLFKFTIYHSRRKKLPTTFMATLAKSGSELLASTKNAYLDRLDSSDLSVAQKAMLLRVAGLKDADSAKNNNDIEVTEQDGVLSTANAKRMLKWLAEGVGRGLELSGGSETPKDVSALLNLLLSNMGEIYVETALDAANDSAASQESAKSEPDLSYLPNLRSAISIMQLMITCIHTVLIPLAASNLTVRRDMEKITNQAIGRMEDKTNGIMQRTVDVVLGWLAKLLAGQGKNDFRPKDGALEGAGGLLEMLQTPTCLAAVTFLKKAYTLATMALTGQNLTAFTTELARGILSQLLEHFKRFPVNATGGLMVTKDLAQYTATLRAFDLASPVATSLEVLPEIGTLFVVGPEALRERLRSAEAAELKPYVMRRDDLGSIDRTPKPNETTESPKTPPTVQVHDSGGLASKRGQPLDTLSQSRARKRPSRLRIPLSQDDAAMTTDKNGDESPPSPSPARATRVLVPSTPPLHPLALFPPTPHSKRDLTILPPTYLPVLESLPPHVHFRPLLLQRPLAPLERGHWRLPTRDFPPALLTRFWTFLGHWIVGGRGGWGVWAVVETCHSALSAIARVEMRREVEYVKLYTFGGTVPQTWSLLVLATERWCKKAEAGAEWVDGEGRVVVKMS